MIDPILHDENCETAILYSIKYKREKIFFNIMNKFKNDISLNSIEYYKMVQYCQVNELDNILNYFVDNWPFDLYGYLPHSLKFLPFCFFINNYENKLDEFFETKDFINFFALASRALHEESLQLTKTYYINDRDVFTKLIEFCKPYKRGIDKEVIDFDTIYIDKINKYDDYDERYCWSFKNDKELSANIYNNEIRVIFMEK